MDAELIRRAIAEWPDDILAWPHDRPIADAFRAAADRGCPLSRALANLDLALSIANDPETPDGWCYSVEHDPAPLDSDGRCCACERVLRERMGR